MVTVVAALVLPFLVLVIFIFSSLVICLAHLGWGSLQYQEVKYFFVLKFIVDNLFCDIACSKTQITKILSDGYNFKVM